MTLQDIPIRRKLIAIILLTTVTALVLARAIFFAQEFLTYRQALLRQLSTLGKVIAANSTAALAFDNQDDAQETLAAIKAEQHVTAAALFDKNGKLFAQYPENAPGGSFPARPEKSGYQFQQLTLAGFQPVVQGDKQLGTLYLQLDTADLMRQWLLNSLGVAILVLLVVSMPAYLISRMLQKQISHPILSLAATARDISERGDFSVRAQKHGRDEIGQLTDGFNQMLEGIQERENALRAANEALRVENIERKRAEENAAWLASFPKSNPNPIIELDLAAGIVHYANPSALRLFPDLHSRGLQHPLFSGLAEAAGNLLSGKEETMVREIEVDSISFAQTLNYMEKSRRLRVYNTDITVRKRAEEETLRLLAAAEKSRKALLGILEDQERAEAKIRELNAELEERVAQRTAELKTANKELEAFSYSVSHDLRAPLRAINGFSEMVTEDYGKLLPEEGQRYLRIIREDALKMGQLIDDLLAFSRLSREPLKPRTVDTESLVRDVLEELNRLSGDHPLDLRIGNLPRCQGDGALLRHVWVNLLSNALKYSRNRNPAIVEIGSECDGDKTVYFVRDNGAGFDMEYANKLFGVFQRLHRNEEFEGTGVGLAIVQRIIHRHGGRVWAQAKVDQGATFYFTLNLSGGNQT